jgi:hypothetical protein
VLDRLAEGFRKLSLILVGVGCLVAFYTEAFADIPVGRDGRPKPPLRVQRVNYLLLIGAGVPGAAWAFVRTVHGRQRTFWD